MFEHFVITRFNLKLEEHFHKDKNGKATQTEEWLKHRFELFETYCYPSLQAQSCQRFKWLVLFDSNTSDFFKKKIDAYQQEFENFYPLFLSNGEKENLKIILKIYISSLSDKNAKQIITTRIDNDDAFHVDMIKEVQSFFSKHKEEIFLNFNYGIQYDTMNCVAIKIRYENNHFLSRLEKNNKELETVIIHDHTLVNKIDRVISLANKRKPMWIEIIHESNVSNTFRLCKPIFYVNFLKSFNLKIPINRKTTFQIWLKYIKQRTYELLAKIFIWLDLFKEYKKMIRICK